MAAAACGRGIPVRQAQAAEPGAVPVVARATLLFIGDVMAHAPQTEAARRPDGSYDFDNVFRHVRPLFDSADLVVANLETTLRTHPPYSGYPMFSAPAELAFAMRRAGIDIALTANNHICDKGARGISSTLALLDSAGIAHTGAFADTASMRSLNPLYREAGGLRFAILAYTYGTNGLPVPPGMAVNLIDTVRIASDLASIDSADCVVVCYHWGDEYRSEPNRAQRELAAWTRARGADIIVGTHPHVVQPVEIYPDKDSCSVVGVTFYSLGNFVSNQRFPNTGGGMIAAVTVTRRDLLPVALEPGYGLIWVHNSWRAGERRYEVLPESAADTVLDGDSRWQYLRFISDSRRLLDPGLSFFK